MEDIKVIRSLVNRLIVFKSVNEGTVHVALHCAAFYDELSARTTLLFLHSDALAQSA